MAFLAAIALVSPIASVEAQTAVGTTSGVQTATVTITATTPGPLNTISVLTRGVLGSDYVAVTPNTDASACTLNTTYVTGATCNVQYTFTPSHPGSRAGGIALADSSGNLLGNVYLTGMGAGPQVAFPPTSATVPTTLTSGNGTRYASGMTLDGAGNLYYVGNSLVEEAVAVSGVIPPNATVNQISSAFTAASGIAIDGSGNLFVTDSTANTITEILAVNGAIPTNPVTRIVATGLNKPKGIRVDSSGNLFVADFGSTSIKKVLAVNGVIPASPTINTIVSGFNVTAISLDAAGDIFFNDVTSGSGTNIDELVSGTTTPAVLTNFAGVTNSLAIDGLGDLYAANPGAVNEIVAVSGSIPASPVILTLGTGFASPLSVAVDANGNIFVGDTNPPTSTIYEMSVQIPPSFTFTSTAAGSTSSDSPKMLTILNNGNMPLSFSVPGSGTNPAVSSGFALASSTCPVVSTTPAGTLAAGTSCYYQITFTPAALGPVTGTLVATDTNLNAAAATQTVNLTGGVSSPMVTVSPASAVVDATSVMLNASVAYTGVTPTGPFTFSVNSATAVASCSGSVSPLTCTASFPPTNLTAGNYVLTGTLTADPSTNSGVGTSTLTITAGTPGISVLAASNTSVIDSPILITANVTPTSGVVPSGPVSFTYGSGIAIANCSNLPLNSSSVACTTSALPLGQNTVTATIAADGNFVMNSGSFINTVSKATPTVLVSSGASTISVDGSVTFTATITPNSPIVPTGTVSFTYGSTPISGCSGLGFNGGTVTCTTTSLPAGNPLTITAALTGDGNFNQSSGSTNETVNMVSPAVSVVSGAPTISVNGSVTFTATITPTGPVVPTGTVSFTYGAATPISGCTGLAFNGGTVTCTTASLPAGNPLTITASITGDSNYNASSGSTSETVNKVTPGITVLSGSASVAVNGPVTFTAAVTPTSGIIPTGTLTFNSGSTVLCSGVAVAHPTCTTSALPAGTDQITATISLDSNFNAATSANLPQTVTMVTPTVTVTSNNATPTVDTIVTFTATLTTTPTFVTNPTGNVSFFNNGNPITNCSAATLNPTTQKATCAAATLVAPSDIITATYNADANYRASTSVAFPQVVGTDATTIAVTATSTPANPVVNQLVTLTAIITPTNSAAGDISPSGSVTFKLGTTALPCSPAVVTSGANGTSSATCSTSFPSAFSATNINVAYNGDNNFITSSGSTSLVVSAAPTKTIVTSNIPSTTVNQSVTFSATFGPANATGAGYPGAQTPQSGTVTFSDSLGGTLCTVSIAGASPNPATCAYTFAANGSHVITAAFTPSGSELNFTASTAATETTVTQVVGAASTTIAITPSTSSASVNQSVTLSAAFANLVSGGGQPSGNVTYYDAQLVTGTNATGMIPGCIGLMVNATTGAIPTCSDTLAAAGPHIITTSFTAVPSTGTYTSIPQSQSSPFTLIVNQGGTTTILTSPSAASTTVDALQVFTASVAAFGTNAGATVPTGTVSFTYNSGATTLCTATIVTTSNGSTATCPGQAFQQAGTPTIVATYGGDTNFTTSKTGGFSQTVAKANTALTIFGVSPANTNTPPTNVQINSPVTFNPTVSSTTPDAGLTLPTGLVTVTDSTTGLSICSGAISPAGTVLCSPYSFTTTGTHAITASYAGDSNFNSTTATALPAITIGAAVPTISVASSSTPPFTVATQSATFTATVTSSNNSGNVPTNTNGVINFTITQGSTALTCAAKQQIASPTADIETCTVQFPANASGIFTVTATYNGDTNYLPVTSTAFSQTVGNFTVALTSGSGTYGLLMAQGTAATPNVSTTDPFSPTIIQFSTTPVNGFGDATVATSCTVSPGFTCATTGAGVVTVTASPIPATGAMIIPAIGNYTITEFFTDAKFPALVQFGTANLTVLAEPAVTIVINPSVTLIPFTLPVPPIGANFAAGLTCGSNVAELTSTGYALQNPSLTLVSLGLKCAVNTTGGYSITLTAGSVGSASIEHRDSRVYAALFGAPVLLLLGLFPAMRKHRKLLLRSLALLFVAILALQGTGCSSGGFTITSQTKAVAGSYLIDVVDSSNQAVAEIPIEVNN